MNKIILSIVLLLVVSAKHFSTELEPNGEFCFFDVLCTACLTKKPLKNTHSKYTLMIIKSWKDTSNICLQGSGRMLTAKC